ncbi:hypothetical protein C723_0975 [Christiangramia flava JLT2011]|nr:hypothetical protein C723_0975 [Christiangramia flava JLT2011]
MLYRFETKPAAEYCETANYENIKIGPIGILQMDQVCHHIKTVREEQQPQHAQYTCCHEIFGFAYKL